MLNPSNYSQGLGRNLRLLYVNQFFTGLIFTVPNWIAFYRQYLTFGQIGLVTALGALTAILLELPTGALADLLGRKTTMLIGYTISGLSFVMVAFSNDFLGFVLANVTMSIGASLVSGADTAFIYDSLKELGRESEFSHFISRYGFVYRISLMIATFAGGYLYVTWVKSPYLAMGLANIMAALITFFLTEPHIDSEKFSLDTYRRQTILGLRQLLQNSYIRQLSFFYVMVGTITWATIAYFRVPFAYELGVSQLHLSWMIGIAYLVSSITLLLLPRSPKLLTAKNVFLGFPILISLTLLPALFMRAVAMPIAQIMYQFLGSGRFSLLDGYTNREFESRYRATAISTLNMLISFSYLLLVGISGFAQDFVSTSLILSVLGLITLIVMLPNALGLVKQYQAHHPA